MKNVKIPVTYTICGYVWIEVPDGSTWEDVARIANENIDDLPLDMMDSQYVDGSYEVNDDVSLIEYINSR